MGPLRCEFYRIGLTIRGTCDVQLGLEHRIEGLLFSINQELSSYRDLPKLLRW